MTCSLPVSIAKNPDQSINLLYQKVRLHSSKPRQEAQRLCENLERELGAAGEAGEATLTIIAGVGWGYIIEEFQDRRGDIKALFFLEPVPEIYELLKRQGRLAELQRQGSKIYGNPKKLKKELLSMKLSSTAAQSDSPADSQSESYTDSQSESYTDSQSESQAASAQATALRLIVTPVYQRLFPDLKSRLIEELQLKSGEEQLDRRTADHFLRQWSRNGLCRLKRAQEKISYIGPRLKCSGRQPTSAIYCGAAPELLEELKGLPSGILDSSFIMAADTALAALVEKGVPIDLTLSVDSGRGTLFHLAALEKALDRLPSRENRENRGNRGDKSAGAPADEARNIPRRASFPALTWSGGLGHLEQWFSAVHYYRSSLPFDQILGDGPLSKCPQWENRARNPVGLAILMAEMLGCPTLYLAGVGFSQSAGRSHVQGSGYTLYGLARMKRTFSLEMYQPGYGSKLNRRDQISLQNACSMAKSRGIELKDAKAKAKAEAMAIDAKREEDMAGAGSAGGKRRADSSPDAVAPASERWQLKGFLLFSPAELKEHLLQVWKYLDHRSLRQMGLPKSTTQRFRMLLANR